MAFLAAKNTVWATAQRRLVGRKAVRSELRQLERAGKLMSPSAMKLLALSSALVVAASASQLASSKQEHVQFGALNANQGIYVDAKDFGIIKGTVKSDPTAELMKLGAQDVTAGALIIRVGDKLYLVDFDPNAKSLYSDWAEDAFRFEDAIRLSPDR
jgi:hypothetical protein